MCGLCNVLAEHGLIALSFGWFYIELILFLFILCINNWYLIAARFAFLESWYRHIAGGANAEKAVRPTLIT